MLAESGALVLKGPPSLIESIQYNFIVTFFYSLYCYLAPEKDICPQLSAPIFMCRLLLIRFRLPIKLCLIQSWSQEKFLKAFDNFKLISFT